MPLAVLVERLNDLTARIPRLAQLGCTVALVAGAFGARQALGAWVPETGMPFLLFWPSILAASVLFAGGAGYLATAAALPAACWFLPPVGSVALAGVPQVLAVTIFAGCGVLTACAIETLRNALEAKRRALAQHQQAEAARRLLLDEFRHRTRNDLQNLCSLLLLRARSAPAEAREALREAAAHAFGLARVHSRIAGASAEGGAAVVDTAAFLGGLMEDLGTGAAGNGLRPIAMLVRAEAHRLSTERAVHLGQVVNECVTNALKYAFPDDRSGTVLLRFGLDGDAFVLCIEDDGIGIAAAPLAPGSGLGTRLLRALGAQLRGTFQREAAEGGGVVCRLRFPAAEPSNPRI